MSRTEFEAELEAEQQLQTKAMKGGREGTNYTFPGEYRETIPGHWRQNGICLTKRQSIKAIVLFNE